MAAHPVASTRRRNPLRRASVVLLVAAGLALVPMAGLLQFGQNTLTDTDGFVDRLAPLAEDPVVQEAVVDAVQDRLDERIDLDAAVGGAIDGLQELGLSDRGRAALGLLEGPIAESIRNAARSVTTEIVTSEGFAKTWRQALRLSHSAFSSALQGEAGATVRVDDAIVSLDLTPVLDRTRQALSDAGWRSAILIPADTELLIPVAEIDGLPRIHAALVVVIATAPWALPLAGVLLIAGVLLSRRRARTTMIVGIGAAVLSALLLVLRAVVRARLTGIDALTPEALGAFADAILQPLAAIAIELTVGGLLVAAIGWVAATGTAVGGEGDASTTSRIAWSARRTGG